MPYENLQVWRLREVTRRTGRSRASVYRDVKLGTFPKPVHLGENCSGWLASEVEGWLQARIALRDNAPGVAA